MELSSNNYLERYSPWKVIVFFYFLIICPFLILTPRASKFVLSRFCVLWIPIVLELLISFSSVQTFFWVQSYFYLHFCVRCSVPWNCNYADIKIRNAQLWAVVWTHCQCLASAQGFNSEQTSNLSFALNAVDFSSLVWSETKYLLKIVIVDFCEGLCLN